MLRKDLPGLKQRLNKPKEHSDYEVTIPILYTKKAK